MKKLFYGNFIHTKSISSLEILKNVVVEVSEKGLISSITKRENFDEQKYQQGYERIHLKPSQFMIPGFVDTHTHAPQYINLGIGIDLPLLQWLQTYTFPQEKRFKDLKHATHVYDKCVKRHLMNGTTTCCYYGTIHLEATKILAQIAENYGQRAFVKLCFVNYHSSLFRLEKYVWMQILHKTI